MTAVRYGDPPLSRLVVTNLDGNIVTMLDHRATNRTFNIVFNGPASGSGLVPSDDPEINLPYILDTNPPFLSNNTRLLYWLRREINYGTGDPYQSGFSGLVMQVEDVAADTPTTRYVAYDPWQYLFSRPIRKADLALPGRNGILYQDQRPNDIALDLILNTIAVDGDVFLDIDVTANVEDCPVILGDFILERGKSVGEALTQLTDTGYMDIIMRPIYDPRNRPGKLCELIIGPNLGSVRHEAVMAWDLPGRNISEMSRMIDGTQLENTIIGYAGDGGEPTDPVIDAASVAQYGEYWGQSFLAGQEDNAVLVELASAAQLEIRKDGLRSLTFSPAPERSLIPLRDYTIGDWVPVWASRHFRDPLQIDYNNFDPDAPGASGYQRIFEIPIEIDDNGVQHVRNIRTSRDAPGA